MILSVHCDHTSACRPEINGQKVYPFATDRNCTVSQLQCNDVRGLEVSGPRCWSCKPFRQSHDYWKFEHEKLRYITLFNYYRCTQQTFNAIKTSDPTNKFTLISYEYFKAWKCSTYWRITDKCFGDITTSVVDPGFPASNKKTSHSSWVPGIYHFHDGKQNVSRIGRSHPIPLEMCTNLSPYRSILGDYRCNILIRPHFPVDKRGINKQNTHLCVSLGLNSKSLSM